MSFVNQVLKSKSLVSLQQAGEVPDAETKSHQQSIVNLFKVFHQIVLVLTDLTGGVLDLPMVVGAHRYHNFSHFQSFLQAFEVFGSGYRDDIDRVLYKRIEKESHR